MRGRVRRCERVSNRPAPEPSATMPIQTSAGVLEPVRGSSFALPVCPGVAPPAPTLAVVVVTGPVVVGGGGMISKERCARGSGTAELRVGRGEGHGRRRRGRGHRHRHVERQRDVAREEVGRYAGHDVARGTAAEFRVGRRDRKLRVRRGGRDLELRITRGVDLVGRRQHDGHRRGPTRRRRRGIGGDGDRGLGRSRSGGQSDHERDDDGSEKRLGCGHGERL